MAKAKDKEKILKAARETQSVNYRVSADFATENYRPEESGKIYIQGYKKQKLEA